MLALLSGYTKLYELPAQTVAINRKVALVAGALIQLALGHLESSSAPLWLEAIS